MTRKLALLLIALTFAACGTEQRPPIGAAPEDPDSAVSAPAQTQPSGPSRRELREPEEGLVDIYPRRFDSHRARGRNLTLLYYSGVDGCVGVDHIDVAETKNKVTVTIYEGRAPDAETCIEIAVTVKSIVKLDRPLGDRKVVDGAR